MHCQVACFFLVLVGDLGVVDGVVVVGAVHIVVDMTLSLGQRGGLDDGLLDGGAYSGLFLVGLSLHCGDHKVIRDVLLSLAGVY